MGFVAPISKVVKHKIPLIYRIFSKDQIFQFKNRKIKSSQKWNKKINLIRLH